MKKSIGSMADIFEVQNFAPSMTIFGLAFLGMFLGTLMSNDRNSSFLTRLFASPLKSVDYILGYSLPILPMAIIQGTLCFITAIIMGLPLNINVIYGILSLLPVALLFISFGLFMGSVLNTASQVSGFGTILINSAVFLSGAVIPLDSIGGTFKQVCDLLPFVHANSIVNLAVAGNFTNILPHILWLIGYSLILAIPSIIVFKKKMKK